jgi:putative endonuclease
VRTSRQRQGDGAESLVVRRVIDLGWSIVERNARGGRGELDIVAVDPGPPRQLVVIEVRSRGRRDFGLPEETVDWRKRALLRRATWRWLDSRPELQRLPIRFDLAVVEPAATAGAQPRVRHHRAAF